MKKNILILLTAFIGTSVQAQNPVLTTFTVEYKNANGNDTTITVEGIGENSFRFLGGKGNVSAYDYTTGTWITREETNKNLFVEIESVDDFNAMIRVQEMFGMREGDNEISYKQFGYCVSKTPGLKVTDVLLANENGVVDNPAIFNMSNCDDQSCYTLHVPNKGSFIFDVQLKGLDYVTTYYIRPFIIFTNGEVMYGSEKSFTTIKTKSAALCSEPEIGANHFAHTSGIVLTEEAFKMVLGNSEEIAEHVEAGIRRDLNRFMTEDIVALLKAKSYKTITCVDGELYLVKELPVDFVSSFIEYLNEDVTFNVVGNLNMDTNDLGNPIYTKNVGNVDTVYCEEEAGVPYNTYLTYHPSTATTNPTISFNIPKYLKSGKYSIYAVIIHPDPVNDPRPNRFYTYIFESETDPDSKNYGEFPTRSNRLTPPEGSGEGNYYITDISKMVDTLYIGDYTFQGSEKCMIQFATQVTSRLTKDYNRTMSISQICIKRIEESEDQNTEN